MRTQRGLVTRAQALELDVSPSTISRLVGRGELHALFPRVFADVGAPPSWEQRALGACLWAGDDSAASHTSAGLLAELDACEPSTVDIWTPRRIECAGVNVHRGRLEPRERTRIRGIPTTAIVRTLIDLAHVLDGDRLEAAVDSAIRTRLVTPEYIDRWIGGYRRRPAGAPALMKLLHARRVDGATESEFEVRFLRLIRDAGLPLPVPQYEVCMDEQFIARVDFAYPEQKVIIECDSYRWHHGQHAWERDLHRRNLLGRLGWIVLNITYWDIKSRPEHVVALVAETIGVRSLFGLT